MHSNITAVRFKGNNRYLSLFNVYNEINNNNTINYLDSSLDHNSLLVHPSATDSIIWLGDFNHHHPMWEDDSNKQLFEPTEYITLLIDLLYKNDMLLVLPKGLLTFQTAARNWTRPGNIWHCNTPDDPIIQCDVVTAICLPMADHLPIVVEWAMPLPRAPKTQTLDFRQADSLGHASSL